MSSVFAAAFLAANFSAYPGLGDKAGVAPRAVQLSPRVEAASDRGPIIEMIVRCPTGTAIISYSKVEHLYCGPRLRCDRRIANVVAEACGR